MRPRPQGLGHRNGRFEVAAWIATATGVVLLGLLSTTTLAAAMPPRAEPFVDCVFVDTDGTQIALFGYTNPHTEAITPNQNHFSPAPGNRGQPSTLQPGTHRGVISVTFTGSKIAWHLDSNKATATIASSPTCASNPAVPEAAAAVAIPIVGMVAFAIWWAVHGRHSARPS